MREELALCQMPSVECPALSKGHIHKPIQIFLNSQRFLCGFGFRLRVSGESGMRGRNFLNRRSAKWKFLNALWIQNSVDAISGYVFSSELTRSSPLPWIFKMLQCATLSDFYFLDLSFQSFNVCAVKPSYVCCTLQLCQTTARHSEASFLGAAVGPTNWTP